MWYFEASFPIDVRDGSGAVIGTGYATAQGDWMTEAYVPFKGEITFSKPTGGRQTGTIVFHKDNASGLPEHDDAFEVPVVFR